MDLTVFRAGHRPFRDKRITTHVALVARAFGASVIRVDTKDTELEETIKKVTDEFGGNFEVTTGVDCIKEFSKYKGIRIYLTMYGEPLQTVIGELISKASSDNIAVLVGSEKIPPEVYSISDYNVSVTNQPHSEVAALALFLDRFFQGSELDKQYSGHLQVKPSARGKKVKMLPNSDECVKLLKKYGATDRIIKHSIAVNEFALKIAKLTKADVKIVNAASLLHDIGRTKSNGIDHAVKGAEILRREPIVEEVIRAVERHMGAGITQEEALELGLPPESYLPISIEEKIVAHSDNLFKGPKRVNLDITISSYEKKGLVKAVSRMRNLHKELSSLCGMDLDELH